MKPSLVLLPAFRHPLLIFSILALLLNDHLLKATAPSALTGKLSDFAGLFFFPFLVGVALQALARLARRRLGARPALVTSFGLCAALFIPIKTLPGANVLVSGLLSSLFASPLKIALDPGDLAALVVFLPAWGLWRRIEGGPTSAAPGRAAYAVLSLGALASLATGPCMTEPSIQRLVQMDNLLYAVNSNYLSAGYLSGYVSEDGGQTWTSQTWVSPVQTPDKVQLPAQALSALAEPAALPLTLCDLLQPHTCYRIDGRPQVEQSQDGGSTWRVAWQVPLERMDYIIRAARGGWPTGCGKTPDLKTFDMLFLPGASASTLVVAVGNDGLVFYSPSNGWQRKGIMTYQASNLTYHVVTPTPWAARTGDEAFQNIQPEWWLAIIAGCLVYLGLSAWAWIYAAGHRQANASRKSGWVFRPLWVLPAWIFLSIVAYLAIYAIRSPATNTLSYVLLITTLAFPLGILIVSVVIWRRAGELVRQPGVFRRLGWQALLAGAAVFIAGWVSLLLWAFGTVVAYGTTLLLAALAGLVALVFSVRWIRRGMKSATTES